MNFNYKIEDGNWFDFIAAADHDAPSKGEELSNEVEKLFDAIKKNYMNSNKVTLPKGGAIIVEGRSFKVGKNPKGQMFIYQVSGSPFIVRRNETTKKDELKALTPLEEVKKNHDKEIVVMVTSKIFDKVPLEEEKIATPPRKRSFIEKLTGK